MREAARARLSAVLDDVRGSRDRTPGTPETLSVPTMGATEMRSEAEMWAPPEPEPRPARWRDEEPPHVASQGAQHPPEDDTDPPPHPGSGHDVELRERGPRQGRSPLPLDEPRGSRSSERRATPRSERGAPPSTERPRRARAHPPDEPVEPLFASRWLSWFTRTHLVVVAIIGLIGLAVAWWAASQASARPIEVAAPTPTPITATAPPASASASPKPTIRIHVLGAVAHPGVVSVPEGARVEDALAAAGGLTPQARPGELNLAQVLTDGAQILIGTTAAVGGEVRGEAAPAAGGAARGNTVLDLNKATAEQLDGLPGVGPVTAQRILAWRDSHGTFSRVEELQEVEGIGAKTLERLAPLVRV